MRSSLILSIVLHALIIGVALINFSSAEAPMSAQPVSVEIVNPSDVSLIKAGDPQLNKEDAGQRGAPPEPPADPVPAAEAAPADKPAQTQAALPPPKPKAPPPAEAETAKTPPPAEAPAEKPASEAKAVEKPQAVPTPARRPERPKPAAAKPEPREKQPERQPQREATPNEPPRRPDRSDSIAEMIDRPTPPTQGESDFDPNRIAALLNRDPTAGSVASEAQRQEDERPREPWRRPSSLQEQAFGAEEPQPRDSYGAREGRDDRMSASDIDAFRAQISRCWTPPVGGLGGEALVVKLRIGLNEDGTLKGPPQIANSHGSPFFRPAADSAVRAVFQCQPYRMPPEKYGQWRDMMLNFDPSRMYGG